MNWNEPKIQIQNFEPNEYVTVCWGVSCDIGPSNQYEVDHNNDPTNINHQADHCGTLTNQWVIDDNNDGTVDRMIETGTDGLGNLICTLYTDATYTQTTDFEGVGINSYIYWTTSAGNRTWHHQGTVIGTDPSHPNRS